MKLFAVFFCIAAPWLNPFAPGPSPTLAPWLITFAFCAFLALILVSPEPAFRNETNKLTVQRLCRALAAAWACAGLISCGMALLQYFGVSSVLSPWINPTSFGEAFANLRQRNQFATLTNISLAGLLWFAAVGRTASPAVETPRFCLMAAAVSLLAVGNAISSSRTGLFQLLLLCGLCAVWTFPRCVEVRRLLLCALLVYCISMFAAPWLAGLDAANYVRLPAWAKKKLAAAA